MTQRAKGNVFWVRSFRGGEYSTRRGISYNSYLMKDPVSKRRNAHRTYWFRNSLQAR